ncbi:Ubiquitin carboxyl-terminal hydrolase 8 [Lamellibrachia satsuma]|nr:Ubiquitin carboxyl-terminal hydrolase 8 [Lamellibrachia satsuma]
MPVTAKKPLYIAKGISELNKQAGDIPKIGNGQCKKYLNTAEKVFKEAQLADSLQDEERAYCLYMRYFNIITGIKKTDEYKKHEEYYKNLIGTKNSLKALEHAEALSEALNVRYNELAEESQNGLNKEDIEVEKQKEHEKSKEKTDGDDKDEKEVKDKSVNGKLDGAPGGVLVEQVYSLIRDHTALLLMDVRPCEQFEQSHINIKSCINVPADTIPPGTTVKAIEVKLPEASRLEWSRRSSTDFVVLYDWDSSAADLKARSVLQSLKDALYKWDRNTILKCEPLVMEGGYEKWLLMYPTLTTNASIPRPPAYSTITPWHRLVGKD